MSETTDLVLLSATVLGVTAVRNSDIATRSRDVVREKISLKLGNGELFKKRIDIIDYQIDQFNMRYIWLSISSILSCLSMIIALFSHFHDERETNFSFEILFGINKLESTIGAQVLYLIFMLTAIIIVIFEFWTGTWTLEKNSDPDQFH